MADLILAFDWSRTPLGPREQWPASLRTIVDVLTATQFPVALLWSQELILIYNDAYRVICGDKHPEALGRSTRDIWSEVWHINQPIFEAVMKRGETLWFEDMLFPINRRGFLENAYFTLCYSPVRKEDDSIGGVLVILEETTGRKQAEAALRHANVALEQRVAERTAALRASEKRYRQLFTNNMIPMALWNSAGAIVDANDALLKMVGYTRADLEAGIIRWDEMTPPEYHELDLRAIREVEQTGVCEPYEKAFLCKTGRIVPILIGGGRFDDQEGTGVLFALDLTERKRAEAMIQQVQKMETVGRLAGGMAHEFNNLIQGIVGYTELCRTHVAPDHPVGAHLNEINVGAMRAVKLVRQLLSFARKQVVMPDVFDLNEHVAAFLTLLRRLVREDVELIWKPCSGPLTVKMDASQVDQVLANLAANSSDAIQGAGRITLATSMTTVEASAVTAEADVAPGRYVMLSFSDTGCGMDEATRSRVFEPFFTTKEVGKGIGMGLASVHGIVKQNKGFVTVESEPGKGTTLRIGLPLYGGQVGVAGGAAAPREGAAAVQPVPTPQRVTILLVDDDLTIVKTVTVLLKALGYSVLAATSPGEAVKLEQEHVGTIDLLLTDVVMPGQNGHELAEQMRARRPGLKCLYMSGYPANHIAEHGILEQEVNFLAKPFNRDQLADKLRQVLNHR